MTDILPGHATAEATKEYSDMMWKLFPRISPDAWRIFGKDLTIGKVGFGTFRIDGQEQQVEAIRNAITEGGINLFETSNTYADGKAEPVLAHAIGELVKSGRVQREQLVIISKSGYVQGEIMERYKDDPPPETVMKSDDMWHCINPEFLKAELDHSLRRLKLQTLDSYLLHNPEYFLEQCVQLGMNLEDARYRYYERIERAFICLEEAVQEGKIMTYGISSNTFVIHKDDPLFTDLAEVGKVARKAAKKVWGEGKRPHFKVVQFPLNLLEMSAIHTKNTYAKVIDGEDEPVSTLELASRMKLSVLTNRPLNAFPYNMPATRLSGMGQAKKADAQVEDASKAIMAIERKIKAMLGGWPEYDGKPLFSVLDSEDTIKNKAWTQSGSIDFDPVKWHLLYPSVTRVAQFINNVKYQRPDREEELVSMCAEYQKEAIKLINGLRHQARGFDVQKNGRLEEFLRPRLPEDWQELPMQQIALNTISSVPGVTCVLCGLRQPEYIHDVMETYKRGNFPDVAQIIGAN